MEKKKKKKKKEEEEEEGGEEGRKLMQVMMSAVTASIPCLHIVQQAVTLYRPHYAHTVTIEFIHKNP
jgi:hypothetical protein